MILFVLLAWEPYTGDVSGLPYHAWPPLAVPAVGLLYETGSTAIGGPTLDATPQLRATPQHRRLRSESHHVFTAVGSSPVVVELPAGFIPSSPALVIRLTAASAEPGPRARATRVDVLHDAAPALTAARLRFEADLAAAPIEERTREVCARRPPQGSPPAGAFDEQTRRYDPIVTWASLPTWSPDSKRVAVAFVARRIEQIDFVWSTAAGCVGDAPCSQDPGGEYYICGAELRASYEVDLGGTVTKREVSPLLDVWHATRAP